MVFHKGNKHWSEYDFSLCEDVRFIGESAIKSVILRL